jgi:hypothetical protein
MTVTIVTAAGTYGMEINLVIVVEEPLAANSKERNAS